ncbi:YdbH domain-containing protein [Shewanella sp. NIFS-20-20]|uniref:YdbH domain-containing protein n=1 Tax=Shewanella sp. NIFS-20-20 TaxID=2853806 RepID=UPI001C476349|nr:YdbH domain-containing protein [Shewanella sp. NIFS-20-20]MBV7316604.1 YdbH domain-containing protein [Shewanella sp. NIFS-20-20]
MNSANAEFEPSSAGQPLSTPSRTSRWPMVFSLCLFVLITLVTVAWLARDAWIKALLNHQLASYPLQLVTLEGTSLDWHSGWHVTIANLSLKAPLTAALDQTKTSHHDDYLTLVVNDINIDTSDALPRVAIAAMQLDAPASIDINQLNALLRQLSASAAKPSPPAATPNLAGLIPLALNIDSGSLTVAASQLDFKQLHIDPKRISVSLALAGAAMPTALTLEPQTGRLSVTSPLSLRHSLRWLYDLAHQGSFASFFESPLARTLTPWLWLQQDPRVAGDLRIEFSATTDNQWRLSAKQLAVELSQFRYQLGLAPLTPYVPSQLIDTMASGESVHAQPVPAPTELLTLTSPKLALSLTQQGGDDELDWQLAPAQLALTFAPEVNASVDQWAHSQLTQHLHAQLPQDWRWLATVIPWQAIETRQFASRWQLRWPSPITGKNSQQLQASAIELTPTPSSDSSANLSANLQLSALQWQAQQLSLNYRVEATLGHWSINHSEAMSVRAKIAPLQLALAGTLTNHPGLNADTRQWQTESQAELTFDINHLEVSQQRAIAAIKSPANSVTYDTSIIEFKSQAIRGQAQWQFDWQQGSKPHLFPDYHRIDVGPVLIQKQLAMGPKHLPRWHLSLPASQLILLPAPPPLVAQSSPSVTLPSEGRHSLDFGIVTKNVQWQTFASVFHQDQQLATNKIISQHDFSDIGLYAKIQYDVSQGLQLSSQEQWRLDALTLSSWQAFEWLSSDQQWQLSGRYQHQSSLELWRPLLPVASQQWLKQLTADLGLSGHYQLNNRQMSQPLTNEFTLALSAINGTVAHVPIDSATLTIPCQLEGKLQPLFSANILCDIDTQAKAINPFTVIEDLSFDGTLRANLGGIDTNQATLALAGHGQLLGGRFDIPNVTLSTTHQASVYLLLQDLDLESIMAKQRLQGIHATGRIDGVLPAHYQDGSLTISGGRLAARPPGGEISLQDNAKFQQLAASQPQLAFALDVLKQLDYKELSSTFDMDAQGDALLKIHLAGTSPSYNRPIVLNYNQSENMLKLIESLQIGNKLQDQLQQKLNADTAKEF